jgi:glycosyltransferase involved in cell wall biosynthesis
MPDAVTVVLPVYRNARFLPELHRRLSAALSATERAYRLIFVNDASPDDSLAVLRQLAALDPHVLVLALAKNVGQNRAVMAGLEHTTTPLAVVMDADLQDPPEAIPQLLAALQPEVCALFAGRRGTYEAGTRLFTSFVFKRLLALLTLGRVPADAGLFVVLRREMIDALLAFQHPDPYVIGLMARTRLSMRSIPVQRAGNALGETGYTTRKRLALALRAFRTMARPIHGAVATPAPIAEIVGTDAAVHR